MAVTARKIVREFGEQFEAIAEVVAQLHSLSEVRPNTRGGVISVREDGGQTSVDFGPVVLRLPERAYAKTADLFVVVTGTCAFAGSSGPLQRLGAKTAYFRQKGRSLEHILAAHYDFDPDSEGHPVFHLQLDSRPDLQEHPVALFHLDIEGQPDDFTKNVLRTSRIPCAHMDFFAVLLQLVADHLIVGGTHPDRKRLFSRIHGAGHIGSAADANRQCVPDLHVCLRAGHWYTSA